MTKGEQTEAEAAVERITELAERGQSMKWTNADGTQLFGLVITRETLRLLLAERRGLREALEPFAECARTFDERGGVDDHTAPDDMIIEIVASPHEQPIVGDFRRARSALGGD